MAGTLYVLIALVAAALTGAPPEADGKAATYQNFFVAHQDALVTQAWLYGLAGPLMLTFAVAVHRVLRSSEDGGYVSGLFLLGTAAVATLLIVTQAMQLAIAERVENLTAEVTFTLGVHFTGVLIGRWGFFMAAAALAYAYCVFAGGVPREMDRAPGGADDGNKSDWDRGRVLRQRGVLPGGRLLGTGAGRIDRPLVPGHVDRVAPDTCYRYE